MAEGGRVERSRSETGGSAFPTFDASSTRERLIAVAMELFWLKGYNSTSVAEILHAAGANSGSLYHFFPTKQDLLVAVLDRYIEGLYPMLIQPVLDRIEDPIERVFGVLEVYRENLVATGCTYGCPIGNLALELHEPDPEVRKRISVNFANWAKAIEGCLDEAADRLPPDVDRGELSMFILTTMEGGVMQSRTHRTLEAFDASVSQLRRYVGALLEEGAGVSINDDSRMG